MNLREIKKRKEVVILFIVLFVSIISACGKSPDSNQNSNNKNDQNPPQKQIEENVTCNPLNNQKREILFAKNISITREFQRTIRYDCDGSVKSDQIETVVSPHGGEIIISPRVTQANKRTEYKGHWRIINRSFCEGRTSYRFNDPDMYEAILFLDMSPGFFSFQVTAGENLIDYDFYACSKVDESGVCLEKGIQENGTVILNVEYKEITRSSFTEFRPTESECKAKPASK